MKTNLLLEVVRLSLLLSGRFFATYGHLKSPHKFTQPQLMTSLVLRAYLKTTYRGVIDVLAASQKLRESIGLKRLPHYSTLERFGDRSSVAEIAEAMFAETIKEFAPPQEEMAVDIGERLFSDALGPKELEIREAFLGHSLQEFVALRARGELGTENGSRRSSRDSGEGNGEGEAEEVVRRC